MKKDLQPPASLFQQKMLACKTLIQKKIKWANDKFNAQSLQARKISLAITGLGISLICGWIIYYTPLSHHLPSPLSTYLSAERHF
jgi:hypothetical protein